MCSYQQTATKGKIEGKATVNKAFYLTCFLGTNVTPLVIVPGVGGEMDVRTPIVTKEMDERHETNQGGDRVEKPEKTCQTSVEASLRRGNRPRQ